MRHFQVAEQRNHALGHLVGRQDSCLTQGQSPFHHDLVRLFKALLGSGKCLLKPCQVLCFLLQIGEKPGQTLWAFHVVLLDCP